MYICRSDVGVDVLRILRALVGRLCVFTLAQRWICCFFPDLSCVNLHFCVSFCRNTSVEHICVLARRLSAKPVICHSEGRHSVSSREVWISNNSVVGCCVSKVVSNIWALWNWKYLWFLKRHLFTESNPHSNDKLKVVREGLPPFSAFSGGCGRVVTPESIRVGATRKDFFISLIVGTDKHLQWILRAGIDSTLWRSSWRFNEKQEWIQTIGSF